MDANLQRGGKCRSDGFDYLRAGLVTLDEMRAKQEVMIKERETQLAQKEKEAKLSKAELKKQKAKEKAQVRMSGDDYQTQGQTTLGSCEASALVSLWFKFELFN